MSALNADSQVLAKGRRVALDQLFANYAPSERFQIGVSITGLSVAVDFACFGLDAQQKLSDDRYMTFFNQPQTPCGAVALAAPAGDAAGFACQLAQLPTTVDRLVFTAAVDGSGTMRQMQAGYLRLLTGSGQEVARFAFNGNDFADEKALMVGELYRKDGTWRFNAIGQGFNGGLAALVKHFGAEVAEEVQPPKPVEPKVSLSKITLEKRGDKISLDKPKTASGYGRIVCNLNWSAQQTQKKGFFGGKSADKAIDLDLGCLYELSDGTKHVVQALGNCFGSYEDVPYIHLAGDDRSGAVAEGEFLYINGKYFDRIRRICIFAFIYEGAVSWTQADAVVTLTVPDHPVIEVRLDSQGKDSNMCAIAMLENSHGALKLTKLNEYFGGHEKLDKHYQWGMKWRSGSK
jgi:tellurite resistance protein TerA